MTEHLKQIMGYPIETPEQKAELYKKCMEDPAVFAEVVFGIKLNPTQKEMLQQLATKEGKEDAWLNYLKFKYSRRPYAKFEEARLLAYCKVMGIEVITTEKKKK